MTRSNSLAALACLAILSAPASASETIDFQRDVLPILKTHCIGCHTEDSPEGGLVMESHQALMKGGDTGLAVTAGEAGSSRMLLMLKGKLDPVMPPEGEERPSEEEIELLEAWIEQGAAGPEGDMPIKRELRIPEIAPSADVSRPITAIALSPDGSQRATAQFSEVSVTKQDGTTVALRSDLNKVNSIQFDRDGSRVLVSSGLTGAYGTAAIFDTGSGEMLREFVGHRDVLYSAVFSPDETIVATAGYDREIILWDAETGEAIRNLTGHNGAIFDLAFSPDGKVLVSACADETVKVWNIANGTRLDTLSQPEGEVFSVAITADGQHVVAGSADNRLRVWKLRSKERPRINPIVATRYVDESPLVNFAMTPDGTAVVVLSEGGNIKVLRTEDWAQVAVLDALEDTGTDLAVSPTDRQVLVSMMNGRVTERTLPSADRVARAVSKTISPTYLDLGDPIKVAEADLKKATESEAGPKDSADKAGRPRKLARGSEVTGVVAASGETDLYRWDAKVGEVWAIDVDATDKSKIDPIVALFDEAGDPVLRTRLQAVRDSYFTFRGKDSKQIADFRLFNWEEMHLNDYLYAAGEVTRLWMYPRGPDSGYNVYPNEGNRWTYFGTTHTTHALGEPAYIVRPLADGEQPLANGLPVFDVWYENDDDPQRLAGKNSRLLFTAPRDGTYTVRVRDTRGEGGENYGYRLRVRPAEPGYKPSVGKANGKIRKGSGREFTVRVDRIDGFDGPVTFDIPDLPPQFHSNLPLTVEQGQRFAVGTLWVDESCEPWEGKLTPELVATAVVNGRKVERRVGPVGELELADRPNAIPSIHPIDREVAENESWTLQVRRGETVSARVKIRRNKDFTAEVSFGKENSGRNTTHGVYVDNIGLNGLLVRANESEREFFLTADPIAKPGKRSFFLTGAVDGQVTTHPITVEVLP